MQDHGDGRVLLLRRAVAALEAAGRASENHLTSINQSVGAGFVRVGRTEGREKEGPDDLDADNWGLFGHLSLVDSTARIRNVRLTLNSRH